MPGTFQLILSNLISLVKSHIPVDSAANSSAGTQGQVLTVFLRSLSVVSLFFKVSRSVSLSNSFGLSLWKVEFHPLSALVCASLLDI